jgi:hypothetical protein
MWLFGADLLEYSGAEPRSPCSQRPMPGTSRALGLPAIRHEMNPRVCRALE